MREARRHFRGDFPQYGRAPAMERRHWARETVADAKASLSWMRRGEMITVKARLVDISLGGAGVLIPRVPPRGALLRLALAADPAIRVDGRAVATRPHPKPGWLFLHLEFQTECPRTLMERALGGSDGEKDDPDDEAGDPPMDDGFAMS